MHASDLLPVLNGSVSGSVLRGKISKEVAEYFLLIQKKGANISLHFNEDIEIILSQKSILTLLTEI